MKPMEHREGAGTFAVSGEHVEQLTNHFKKILDYEIDHLRNVQLQQHNDLQVIFKSANDHLAATKKKIHQACLQIEMKENYHLLKTLGCTLQLRDTIENRLMEDFDSFASFQERMFSRVGAVANRFFQLRTDDRELKIDWQQREHQAMLDSLQNDLKHSKEDYMRLQKMHCHKIERMQKTLDMQQKKLQQAHARLEHVCRKHDAEYRQLYKFKTGTSLPLISRPNS